LLRHRDRGGDALHVRGRPWAGQTGCAAPHEIAGQRHRRLRVGAVVDVLDRDRVVRLGFLDRLADLRDREVGRLLARRRQGLLPPRERQDVADRQLQLVTSARALSASAAAGHPDGGGKHEQGRRERRLREPPQSAVAGACSRSASPSRSAQINRSVAWASRIAARTKLSSPSVPPGATFTRDCSSRLASSSPLIPSARSQTKFAWLSGISTGMSSIASRTRLRCSITVARRRWRSRSPILSAWSTAACVSAFTPSIGAIEARSEVAEGAPTTYPARTPESPYAFENVRKTSNRGKASTRRIDASSSSASWK